MIAGWYAWIFGGIGVVGIAALIALSIFGGPAFALIVKIADAILTPIAGVVGQGCAMLVKAEIGGGIDMVATGQRILFVITIGAMSYGYAEHNVMKWTHRNFWLTQKHYQVVVPHAVARGHR